jgi:arylsulfatase A-like enzyme
MSRVLPFCIALCLPGLIVSLAASSDRPSRHPNIIVILADDLGYGDPTCYNKESQIPTPHIDRLASQGMRFTDAHSPSAVCTPTRYGLLTGRYCWRSRLKRGVLFGYDPLLIEPGRMTLASLLRLANYFCAGIGKWHLGLGNAKKTDYAQALTPGPNSVGFNYYYGIPSSLDIPPYLYFENERPVQPPSGWIEGKGPGRKGRLDEWRAGPLAPGFKHQEVLGNLTGKALEVIGKQSADRPFFLYFALSAPHIPWVPSKNFEGKSKVGLYGDLVMEVDDTVGQIMKVLEEKNLADNTLLIFTSDNGAYWWPADIQAWKHRANANLHGQKADIWEGGHRVPFIARWPGHVPAGTISGETICLTDLLATLAAIVGQKLPKNAGEDSFNLLPLLEGHRRDRAIREATVLHSGDGTFAIRQGPWRLENSRGSHGFSQPLSIKAKPGEPQGELYRLDQDLEERHNRWLEEPALVRRLTDLLEKYKNDGRSRP